MAEGYIDLSGITGRIDRLSSNLNTINNNINSVSSQVQIVNNAIQSIRKETLSEINAVKKQIVEMMRTQKFQSALQVALTEIIRVRQELEHKFGTQKLVRDSMLGILQAADLSLVTESTISKCTEELMISAPNYWLAPCLIALAAWISNNESLAKRAIDEACKRDMEKTCLLFALITRRVNAGRMQANKSTSNVSFEWLGEYFKEQRPEKMSLSIIAYIDAYANGIFGEDKDNICQEHIDHWMEELKEKNPNFVAEQEKYWENIFESYCNDAKMNQYSELKQVCQPKQFQLIANYLVRIDASERSDGIKSYVDKIMKEPVDTEKLIKDIDDQLVRLVNQYEEDEVQLRNEEERLNLIKEFNGDEERADRLIDAKRNKQRELDAPVDFAQRLSEAILDANASNSARKTAVKLLRPYISVAFNNFITANKETYPEEIQLQIKDEGKKLVSKINGVGILAEKKEILWNGTTTNCSNREELIQSLQAEYEAVKKDRISKILDEEALKKKKTGMILTCTILGALVGLPMMFKGKKMLLENAQARLSIAKYYDDAAKDAVLLLNKALDQRVEINQVISTFLTDKKNEVITL